MKLDCPEDERLSLYMKDCTVSARQGYDGIKLIEGKNIRSIELDRVEDGNLLSPEIDCCENTKITVKN